MTEMTIEQIDELAERSKDDRAIIVGSEVRQLCATARRYAELLAGIEGRLLAIQLEASLSRIGSHEELCRSLESIRDEAAAALRQLKEQPQ